MLLDAQWLKNHLIDEDLVILDTRPKTAFLYGHISNALSLTIENMIKLDQYGSNLAPDVEMATEIFSSLGIDDTKTVLIYGDPMDPSSARIAWTLLYFGHGKTFLLDCSMSELSKNGIDLTKKITPPKPTKFAPIINHKIRILSDDLNNNLEKFLILDARTFQEYVRGHIPGSILKPYSDGISYSGQLFNDKASLQNLFLDIKKDKEIVCYCMHGHRASSLFFQLKIAGFDNVKLYDGSFMEWYGKKLRLE